MTGVDAGVITVPTVEAGPTRAVGAAPEARPVARMLPAALWLAQSVIAGVLTAAATAKLSAPLPDLALGKVFAWTGNVPPQLVRPVVVAVALAELLVAVAIVLPPWNASAARFSRTAAWAAALEATFATVRLAHGDAIAFRASLVLCGFAALVAWGRSRLARQTANDGEARRGPDEHGSSSSSSRTTTTRGWLA